jgi:hypothetical protein
MTSGPFELYGPLVACCLGAPDPRPGSGYAANVSQSSAFPLR